MSLIDDFLSNRDITIPYINRQGDRFWVGRNGEPYRENDLPVKESANGTKEWHNAQGWLHRTTGPAKVYADGREEYHVVRDSTQDVQVKGPTPTKKTPPTTPSRYNRTPLL